MNTVYFATWVLSCLFLASAEEKIISVQQCCENNGTLDDHGMCIGPNREFSVSLIAKICAGKQAFILQPSMVPSDNFTILVPSGELMILHTKWRISRENFCLDKNRAVVCISEDIMERSAKGLGMVPTVICCLVSSFCLLLTLITYILVPKLRNLQGKCVMCMITSQFSAFIFLAIFQYTGSLKNEGACLFMASMVYITFLFVFFWLNVISFNVWQALIKPRFFRRLTSSPYLWYWYCAWGWGGPITLLLLTLILHFTEGSHIQPGFAKGGVVCWFTSSQQIWLYFYGPITIILISNLVMFIWSAVRIWLVGDADVSGQLTDRRKRSHVHRLALHVKLFIVMGICWTFEPISGELEFSSLWIITDYINALQGVIIFLLLVVFRKKARVGLAEKLPFLKRCCPQRWVTDDNTSDDSDLEDYSSEEEGDLRRYTNETRLTPPPIESRENLFNAQEMRDLHTDSTICTSALSTLSLS